MMLIALVLVSTSGCQWLRTAFVGYSAPKPPVVFEQGLTGAEQVVNHMKTNAQRINQLESAVSVQVAGMPRLNGNLLIEVPRNLRLKAGLLGMTEMGVDVGSNNELFWVWAKNPTPGQRSALYYARHDDYANSPAHDVLPMQPQWILDAMGLVHFDPNDRHETPFVRDDGNIQLNTTTQTAAGLTRKVSVLDPKYGWIKQQSFYVNDRLVAYANAYKFEYLPEHQISLPRQVVIHLNQPDGNKFSLTIDFSRFKVNQFYGDPEKTWAMPNLSDIPMIDISKIDPSQMPDQSAIPARQSFNGYPSDQRHSNQRYSNPLPSHQQLLPQYR
jgi:hypothetical protein